MKVRFQSQDRFIEEWIRIARAYAEDKLALTIPKADADILLANRMERIPRKRSRQVIEADTFSCPDAFRDGWDNLRRKIENGEDLYPHVSRQIKKSEHRDPMLMHWDINHFHIGIGPDPRHEELIQGGSHIIYAHVTDDVFYVIALLEHGHWEDVNLIETIKRNWPDNQHLKNSFVLTRRYTQEETLNLRKNHVNIPTFLNDGTYYFGGGETAIGYSATATMKATQIRKWFGMEQSRIANAPLSYFKHLVVKEGDSLKAEIRLDNNDHFVLHLPDQHLQLALNIPRMPELIEFLKG